MSGQSFYFGYSGKHERERGAGALHSVSKYLLKQSMTSKSAAVSNVHPMTTLAVHFIISAVMLRTVELLSGNTRSTESHLAISFQSLNSLKSPLLELN